MITAKQKAIIEAVTEALYNDLTVPHSTYVGEGSGAYFMNRSDVVDALLAFFGGDREEDLACQSD